MRNRISPIYEPGLSELMTKNIEVGRLSFTSSYEEGFHEVDAIYDSFHGDRIVIETNSEKAAKIVEEVNRPFGVPVYKTDIRSAEMIKYASNAFSAMKISSLMKMEILVKLLVLMKNKWH